MSTLDVGVRSVAIIGNGDIGVSGSPISAGQSGAINLSLNDTGVEAGEYFRVTVDRKGRVTAGTSLTADDVVAALGFTPINQDIEVYATGGDVWGSGRRDAVLLELSPTGVEYGTYERVVVDRKGRIVEGLSPSNRKPLITLSGDVVGVGTDQIEVTLTQTGVSPGTYERVVVDSQGRIRGGMPPIPPRPIVLVGDVAGSIVGSVIVTRLGGTGVPSGTYTKVITDSTGRIRMGGELGPDDVAEALGFTPISVIRLSGDVVAEGSGDLTVRLAPSGVSAGTYSRVAVDTKGRVIGGLPPLPSQDTLATVTARGAVSERALRIEPADNSSDPALFVGGDLSVSEGASIAGPLAVASMSIGGSGNRASFGWRGNSAGEFRTVLDAPSFGIDFSLADNFHVVLRGHRVLVDPVSTTPGQRGAIWIEQNATGGWTLAFGPRWLFPNNQAPLVAPQAGAMTVLLYFVGPRGEVAVQVLPNIRMSS